MNKSLAWGLGAIAAAVLGGVLTLAMAESKSDEKGDAVARLSGAAPQASAAHPRGKPGPTSDELEAEATATPKKKQKEKASERARRRALADKLRQKLVALYGAEPPPTRANEAAAAPARTMPAPAGSGNQAKEAGGKYVQRMVREQFYPVAGSCYEQLLERKPDAQGDVVLDFSIVGNTELGGVVEKVEVHQEGTTLDDEEFVTCVRESMYTTMFDAPPEGQNSVTVRYPFSFAP